MDTNKIIDSLGGTVEVARLCDVKPQAVSQWRSKGIPKYRLQYLELLKPDVFGVEQGSTGSMAEPAGHE